MAKGDKGAKRKRRNPSEGESGSDSPESGPSLSSSDVHAACCRFTSDETQDMILEQLLARGFLMDKSIKFNSIGFNSIIRGTWSLFNDHDDPGSRLTFERLNPEEVSFVKNIKSGLASISKVYGKTDKERKMANEQMLGYLRDELSTLTNIIEVFICIRLLLGLEGCFRVDNRIKRKDHKDILVSQVKWLRSKRLLKDMTIESFTRKWINEERQSRVDGVLPDAPPESEHPANINELRINGSRHLQFRSYLRERMRQDICASINEKIAASESELCRLRAQVKFPSFFSQHYLKCERYIDAFVLDLDPEQGLSSLLVDHCRKAIIIEAELHCGLPVSLSGHCGLGCDFTLTSVCTTLVSCLSSTAKSYRLSLAGGEPDSKLAKYYESHNVPSPVPCLDLKSLPFKENDLIDSDEQQQPLIFPHRLPAIDFAKYLNMAISLTRDDYCSAGVPAVASSPTDHSPSNVDGISPKITEGKTAHPGLYDGDKASYGADIHCDIDCDTFSLSDQVQSGLPLNSTVAEHNMRLLSTVSERLLRPETNCVSSPSGGGDDNAANSDVTTPSGSPAGAMTANEHSEVPTILTSASFSLPRPPLPVNKRPVPASVLSTPRDERGSGDDELPRTPGSGNGSFILSPTLARSLNGDMSGGNNPDKNQLVPYSPDENQPTPDTVPI